MLVLPAWNMLEPGSIEFTSTNRYQVALNVGNEDHVLRGSCWIVVLHAITLVCESQRLDSCPYTVMLVLAVWIFLFGALPTKFNSTSCSFCIEG